MRVKPPVNSVMVSGAPQQVVLSPGDRKHWFFLRRGKVSWNGTPVCLAPPAMLGPLLTHWTIRLALAAYALWLAGWLWGGGKLPSKWQAGARWLYTAACALFLAHVACAFHFYHGWSHQAALDDTARQTEEMLGFAFGEGIYFSYLFTALWVADVAWLWLLPSNRPLRLTAAIQLYMAFIALNGAVVFEGGVTRWMGVPVALVLGSIAVWQLFTPHSAFRSPQ